ncbi:hypothetical protein [Streptomyces sp. R41]|uniref:Uncharacterized protein n=1 Tax=Streptomyces sp. R41 TaxID=3238632 RepID=A0AB39REX9_9ACTN
MNESSVDRQTIHEELEGGGEPGLAAAGHHHLRPMGHAAGCS